MDAIISCLKYWSQHSVATHVPCLNTSFFSMLNPHRHSEMKIQSSLSKFILQMILLFLGQNSYHVHKWCLLIWLLPTSTTHYGLRHCLPSSLQKCCASNWSLCIHHFWFDPHFIYYMLSSVVWLVPLVFPQYDMSYAKINLSCVYTQ